MGVSKISILEILYRKLPKCQLSSDLGGFMKSVFKAAKIFAVVLMAALLVTSCASQRDPNAEYELTILHTNDHHGSVLTRPDSNKVGHGGLAERATFIKQARAQNENVLLLGAGDVNMGQAVSNMFAAEPDIKAYNLMGYEAVTFGNHEFDGTLAKLEKQMSISKFPWLSANIKRDNGRYLGKQYIIKKYPGFTVGIFGLTTTRTQISASPDKSLTFIDEIEAAKETVDYLRNKKKVDIVIALTHIGDVIEAEGQNTSVMLAEQVEGIDLIIDGHSHTYMAEPKIVNSTPIVSANEWGKYVGKADITVKNGHIQWFSWKPIEITDAAFPPDADMTALLQPYVDEANKALKRVVMTTSAEFPFSNEKVTRLPRYGETASGDLLCDAAVWQLEQIGVHADFAIYNGGGIRTSLPAGDVTSEDILTMLPFENIVYVMTLKGSDVMDLFNFIPTMNQGAGAFAQVSSQVSYTLTFDREGKNGRISNVLIDGKPIDTNKTYRIATNDYLAKGGDGYVAFTKAIDSFNSSILINDMVVNYVKTLPSPVEPKTYGRITIIGGVNQ